jgi:transcriptional repressor NrdR|tara:strand:+ start:26995 stop:27516 length:522 start_codon:yes stop_codon:yes gene_type:complete
MYCPFCNFDDTKVIDSRLTADNTQVKRRRECSNCGNRWSTLESADLNLPRVIKKDNSREDFSEKKVERGILRALNKRSVDKDAIDIAIQNIKNKLKAIADKEIISSQIGILVMQELRELDQVAYIRFASVYHSFEDLQAFQDIIEIIEKDLTPEMMKTQLKLIDDETNNKKKK